MKNTFQDVLRKVVASHPPAALRAVPTAENAEDDWRLPPMPKPSAPAGSIPFSELALIFIGIGLILLALGVASQLHPPTSSPSRGLFRLAWDLFGPMGDAFFFYGCAFIATVMGVYIWKRFGWIDSVLYADRVDTRTSRWKANISKYFKDKDKDKNTATEELFPNISHHRQPPPSTWRRFARDHLRWPVVTVLFTSLLIVYVIPVYWIRQIPGMNSYLEFIPTHIPGIREYIAASRMSQLASVYFPIMTLIGPLLVFEIWQARVNPERWTSSFWQNPIRNFFFTLWVGILMVGSIWASYGIGGGEVTALSISDSKLGLSLLGPIYSGGGVWCFIGIFTRAIFSIISKEGRK